MATKKFLTLDRLTEYDALIKAEITEGDESVKSYVDTELAKKANSSHSHAISDVTNLQTTLDEISEKANESDVFIVNVTTTTADKTYAEISEAYNSGKHCFALYTTPATKKIAPLLFATSYAFQFAHITVTGKNVEQTNYIINLNNEFSITKGEFTQEIIAATNTNSTLETTDKTLVGAINEVHDELDSHSHDDLYYTETEIDTKLSTINTSITNITSGSTPVKEAEHATSADSADEATHATSADSATKATQDGSGNVIVNTYETKSDANAKLAEAKSYADSKVSGLASTSSVTSAISTHNSAADAHNDIREALAAVKEDVDAFFKDADMTASAKDTLKELQDYITSDAAAAQTMLDSIAGKADAVHTHAIADVTGLQTALDGKAAASHGTHVTYSTTAPVMDGTASVGTATTVARSDHKHPTDTSRAAQTDLDSHTSNTTVHITSTERTNWGTAYTHSQAAHAPSNAEKNQNAFSNVVVGSTTIAADTTTDSLTIAAGTGISVAGDATNDKVTITNSGVIAVSTGSANGTISVNTNGTSANVAVKGLGSAAYTNSSAYATADHTHTVDSALSSTSTNPVQNKVVNSAISTLTSSVSANTSSISSHTTAISNLQTAVDEIQEITSAEIQALFA